MRHRILLAASAAYLGVANLIWIARDTRPPFWDTACHESLALKIYDSFVMFGMIAAMRILPGLTGYYPPFYHSIVAVFFRLFGRSVDVAQLANLPALALLLFATYGIGRTVLSRMSAAAAAALANFYPLMLWLSRETLIDYWLTSIVALTIWLLVTKKFETLNWAVVTGLVCAAGMLTKWTFAFFVALPFVWMARDKVKNAAISAAIGAFIPMYWYVPQFPALKQLLSINNAGGVGEGDPPRLSFQAVVFYVRALEGYQVFFPLFAVFVAGAIILSRRFDPAWTPVLLWLVGGWLALMMFQNKDPRYSVPFLPAVALISANVFDAKPLLLAGLLPFLMLQHYLVSFGIRELPEKVVLMNGVRGPLSYDWNLYTQTYFHLWGPPAREDWKIEHVLDTVAPIDAKPVRLGIAPNIARFDPVAFEFYIALQRRQVTINRLWHFDEEAISNNDFILVSETGSEITDFDAILSPDLKRIGEYVQAHRELFAMIERFALPNGTMIRLYKVNS